MSRITRAAEALGIRLPKQINQQLTKIAAVVMSLTTLMLPIVGAEAATLSNASMGLSDPQPSATSVNYNLTGSSFSGGTIRCVKEVFATTPSGSTKPTGMITASGITIDATQNLLASTSGWNRGGSDPDGTVTFVNNSSSEAPSGTKTWKLSGFQNSSVADTGFWVRFSTYGNQDCSSSPVDNVTVGFILTNGSTLSLTVDQTLSFTVNAVSTPATCAGVSASASTTSTTIPFGTVSAAGNSVVCQDLTAATNATNGYTIFTRYTAKPTNALSQTINDVSPGTNNQPAAFSSSGTEAYGYSTNDLSLSGTAGTGAGQNARFTGNLWAAMSTTNAEVGYESSGVTSTTYRVSHQAGVSLTTRPGIYTTTVIYTCTPVY